MIKYILLILFVLFILIQIHETQHYQDFKNLNCTNIEYRIVQVKAFCPDMDKAENLSKLRDKQFLSLWMVKK